MTERKGSDEVVAQSNPEAKGDGRKTPEPVAGAGPAPAAEPYGGRMYRGRHPVKVRALRWTGENAEEMAKLCGTKFNVVKGQAMLQSVHGLLPLEPGDYVTRSPMGTCALYMADRFEANFELLPDGNPQSVEAAAGDPDLLGQVRIALRALTLAVRGLQMARAYGMLAEPRLATPEQYLQLAKAELEAEAGMREGSHE